MILNNLKTRIFTSIILLALLVLIISYKFFLIFFTLILGVFSILEFFNITQKIFKKKTLTLILNCLFITYIFTFCLIFITFSDVIGLKMIIYLLLFGCIASDLGGYIIGKIFKGPKLSKISPNKTISGAIGSILFTTSAIYLFSIYFHINLNTNLIIVSLILSIGCQIGDLFFSFLKRRAKIKDTGNILPGHGGVLDRIDGILFGVPIGLITLFLIY